MKTFHLIALGALLLAGQPLAGYSVPDPETKTRFATLGPYKMVFIHRRFDPKMEAGIWEGGSESVPEWVPKEMYLIYRGGRRAVQRSAYADLADVHAMKWIRKGNLTMLVIEGGDAAGAYHAYIRYRNGTLLSRRVEDGEFPDNFFYETTYTSKPVKD